MRKLFKEQNFRLVAHDKAVNLFVSLTNASNVSTAKYRQGGHKPRKHGKPGKLRESENLSNLNFVEKTWKTWGK